MQGRPAVEHSLFPVYYRLIKAPNGGKCANVRSEGAGTVAGPFLRQNIALPGTLAKALGVSSKTAQGMVKDLREKLQKNGADILARTRHGYLLQVNDRALFETLSSGENAAAHFYSFR